MYIIVYGICACLLGQDLICFWLCIDSTMSVSLQPVLVEHYGSLSVCYWMWNWMVLSFTSHSLHPAFAHPHTLASKPKGTNTHTSIHTHTQMHVHRHKCTHTHTTFPSRGCQLAQIANNTQAYRPIRPPAFLSPPIPLSILQLTDNQLPLFEVRAAWISLGRGDMRFKHWGINVSMCG